MIRITSALLLLFISAPCWAQFWIEPAVNFGTTRLEWGPVSMKASKPSWEIKGGTSQIFFARPVSFINVQASFTSGVRCQREILVENLESPLTISGQTFGKKNGQAKGQAQAGQGSQETVVVDVEVSRASIQFSQRRAPSLFGGGGDGFLILRCERMVLSVTASGKVEGKQVEATEAFTRLYPQVGLAYVHREGRALVSVMGTVGQRSSHLEANLNWNVYPDVWIGIGGKRDCLGFDQGRVESAVFTLKGGVTW